MNLEKSILATVIYYDCLDWPLSAFEIWSRLIKPLQYRDAIQDTKYKILNTKNAVLLRDAVLHLEQSPYLKRHVAQQNGFWFLRVRQELV
ncbi:MAG: hypothetical protein HY001_02470, partial [Candidatus Portnoybacteria bacterium]|nr:hypothetical protein [Candidatus Portnoybacteria bacterium]